MPSMPTEIMIVLQHFAPVFSPRIWDWVPVLVMGAILSPHQRTVTMALRMMGLSSERQFQNYHRVLNRAVWSGLDASRIMLGLLVAAFVPADAPLILAADETLERRRGKKIAAKGHFRDPLRSSEKKTVVSQGLRWVSLMLLVSVPWSKRVWALPFLTLPALHPKTSADCGKRHKTSIDVVRQMTSQVRRWLPQRRLVLVTDGGLIAVKLGLRCLHYTHPVTFVSRLHLNIRLFDPPQPKPAGQRGAQARVGQRQPSLDSRLRAPKRFWARQNVTWYGGKQRRVEWMSGVSLWHTPVKNSLCPSAGCWCATRQDASSPRPFVALTSPPARSRSSPGTC